MKRYLLPSLLIVGSLSLAKAQIVLDKDDFVKPNKEYEQFRTHDTSIFYLQSVDFGEPGPNKTYDFRTLPFFGYDTVKIETIGPDQLGSEFTKQHPTATAGAVLERDWISYRDPMTFSDSDLPKAGDAYDIEVVDPNSEFFGNAVHFFYHEDFEAETDYFFGGMEFLFNSTSGSDEYLEPSKTKWPTDFPDADLAKLHSTIQNDGSVIARIYNFYEKTPAGLVKTNVGVEIDKGFVATQTPSGVFVKTTSKVTPQHLSKTTNRARGEGHLATSSWQVEVQEGITTMKHKETLYDTLVAVGTGILYLDHDSFQVSKLIRYQRIISETEFLISGNSVGTFDDDSVVVSHEYYARGFGDPVLKVDFTEDQDSVIAMQFISEKNKVPFTKQNFSEVFARYGLFSSDDNKSEVVGLSALIDIEAQFFGRPSGKIDTLHAPYKGSQLLVSTAFETGFQNKDEVEWKIRLNLNDTAEIEIETLEIKDINVDGHGSIYLFKDTASVLRATVTHTAIEKTNYYSNGYLVDSETDTSITYSVEYWGKDAGMPLLKVEFDDEDHTFPMGVEFTSIPDLPTSVQSKPKSGFSVYPNPASDQVTVTRDSKAPSLIELLDINGKQLISAQMGSNFTFDVSHLEKGIYMVRILDLEGRQSELKKLVIQ